MDEPSSACAKVPANPSVGAAIECDALLNEVLRPAAAESGEGLVEPVGTWVGLADADEERPAALKLFFLMGVMRPRRNELSRRSFGEALELPSTPARCSTAIVEGIDGCCCSCCGSGAIWPCGIDAYCAWCCICCWCCNCICICCWC
jgi:hypothetical protein